MRASIKKCARAYAKKNKCTIAEGELALRTSLEVIVEALLEGGGFFYMNNFIIDVVNRKERKGINPNTRILETIPAYKTLKITVGKELRKTLNKPE